MSRIRSIHPGLFTDEAFMSASAHARLFILGLWTEAWDDGVFEWKPLTLKARIFPVDNVDVATLLEELERLQFICKFTSSGKPYGAIRNFRKYQKPKTPNSSSVLPDSLRKYVAIDPAISPESGNGSGKSAQMEEGGGKVEEVKVKGEDANASSARGPVSEFRKEIMAAFHAAGSTAFPDTSRAAIWLENGWKPSVCLAVISEVLSRNKSISALKYFEQAIADAHLAPVGKTPAPRFGTQAVVGIKPHVRESLVWVEEGSDGWAAWKRAKPGYVHSQLEERTENGKTLVGAYLPSAQPVKQEDRQGEAA